MRNLVQNTKLYVVGFFTASAVKVFEQFLYKSSKKSDNFWIQLNFHYLCARPSISAMLSRLVEKFRWFFLGRKILFFYPFHQFFVSSTLQPSPAVKGKK